MEYNPSSRFFSYKEWSSEEHLVEAIITNSRAVQAYYGILFKFVCPQIESIRKERRNWTRSSLSPKPYIADIDVKGKVYVRFDAIMDPGAAMN